MKPWLKMLGLFLLIVLVTGGIYGFNIYNLIQGFKNAPPPMFTVSTAKTSTINWSKTISAVSNLKAENGIDLVVESSAVVSKINYKSGDVVDKGAIILTLRSEENRARLASLKSSARLAQANFARDKKQLAIKAISKANFEISKSQVAIANSQVREQNAILAKKIVRAPFAGVLGIISIDVGQYLPITSVVTSLQNTDSLFVDFNIPQAEIIQIKVDQKVLVNIDSQPNKKYVGKIIAIDNKVDKDTRNIKVRAQINNDDKKLLSGMFANVIIELDSQNTALSTPQTAVNFSAYGQTVFVVSTAGKMYDEQIAKLKQSGVDEEKITAVTKPKNIKALTAKQIFVTTGAKRGDQVEILSGLSSGDEVVTSGQLKIKNGSLIKINNSVQPANNPNPQPVDK